MNQRPGLQATVRSRRNCLPIVSFERFDTTGWQNVISLKAVFEFLEQRGKRGKLSESVAGTALSHICARTPIDEVAAEFAESANQILASQYLHAKLMTVRIAGATVWPVMVDRV